ncbi:uncharacterized protein LOC132739537 [Ruditapes philippinarum]|uniref:uncharacterized protein LOC132739537 n=1 Tax=Ruditapes philippinarum TaxID=129788 RepID=UPI00295B5196|nr:uncharacterized protein LOC132739537 [Ruditapes philippinarum]
MDHTVKRTLSLETDIPFLLENFRISSIRGIILAMVFALVVAVVFHTLNFIIHFRERHILNRKSNCYYFATTVFHTISSFLAYVMVYCVMTYNVWLLVSILLGSGIGQLIIGPFISIRLENSYISAKNESNDVLTDLLPEYDTDNINDDVNNRNLDPGRQNGAVKPNSTPIELKDFIINKPNEHGYKSYNGNNLLPFTEVDDDQKSEYDSLISDV